MMNIKNWTRVVIKSFYSFIEIVAWFGYIFLGGIVLLVFVDVGGRYIFNKPLLGAFESVELAMNIVAGAAVMYTTVKRGHVSIDILTTRFSRHTQIIMQSVFSFLGFVAWLATAYQIFLLALSFLKKGVITNVLSINCAPTLFFLATAVFLSSLTSLIQIFDHGVSDVTVFEEGGRSQ